MISHGAAETLFCRAAPARLFQLCLTLIGLFLAGLLSSGAEAAALRSIDFGNDAGRITMEVVADAPLAGVSSFALNGPRRLVIDMTGARLGTVAPLRSATGARLRAAQFSQESSRLVIDLEQAMTIESAGLVGDGAMFRLVLRAADAAQFDRLTKAPRVHYGREGRSATAVAVPAAPPVASPAVARPPAPSVAAPAAAASVVDSLPPRRIAAATRTNRPLVVIDAGHGGHDVGAISVHESRREKDVTLAMVHAIRDELESSGRVRVALTRRDDRYLQLGERVEVARRQKADLFISVHADSAPNAEARGATVYTLSEVASDREAARLAAKENKSDMINGVDLGREASDVSSILIDLARRDTMNVSSAFAALLQRELAPYVLFKTQFHRFAGFRVLKAPDTPSVLLETGYLSNIDDAKFLFSTKGQKAVAKGVAKAVEAHFARRVANR